MSGRKIHHLALQREMIPLPGPAHDPLPRRTHDFDTEIVQLESVIRHLVSAVCLATCEMARASIGLGFGGTVRSHHNDVGLDCSAVWRRFLLIGFRLLVDFFCGDSMSASVLALAPPLYFRPELRIRCAGDDYVSLRNLGHAWKPDTKHPIPRGWKGAARYEPLLTAQTILPACVTCHPSMHGPVFVPTVA